MGDFAKDSTRLVSSSAGPHAQGSPVRVALLMREMTRGRGGSDGSLGGFENKSPAQRVQRGCESDVAFVRNHSTSASTETVSPLAKRTAFPSRNTAHRPSERAAKSSRSPFHARPWKRCCLTTGCAVPPHSVAPENARETMN